MIRNFFKILFYFVTFVALGAVVALFVFKIAGLDGKREVPSIVGQSIPDAAEILNNRGLLLNVEDQTFHEEILEGHVVSQSIDPGVDVDEGTEIKIVVSKGMELFSMPSFEGQFLKDAKLTLNNLGMKVKKITWVHSDALQKGRIIAQRPLPGNIESNEINFLVSLGPYEVFYRCPSFVNMTIDDARLLAEELGIKLVEKDRGGRVIFQKPEAGAIIKKGDSVEVKLGRGWGMWF